MQGKWPVFVAAFGATYTFSIGNVTAPRLGPALGASAGEVTLVLAAFAVSFAAGLILAGRLGDRYGRRRMLITGLLVLAVASALGAAAPGLWWLVAARVVQGASSAVVMPQTLAIIQSSGSGRAQARGIAKFTASSGVGTVAGQIAGGLVMGMSLPFAGWRGAVLTSAIPAVVALLGAGRLPAHVPHSTERPDFGGAARVGIPLLALVAGLSLGPTAGWASWPSGLVGCGLVGLSGFWLNQRRREAAGRPVLVAPSVLRQPALRLGLLMTVLLFAGYGAFSYEYSMLTQTGMGLTPVRSGLALTAFAGTFVIAGLQMPRIVARFGDRTMELAAVLLTIGLALLGTVSWFTRGAVWIGCFEVLAVFLGAAQASQYGPLVATVMAAVPPRIAGLAGGLFTTAQQAALALGIATIGGLFGALAPSLGWQHAFATTLGVQVITTVLFWTLARRLRNRPAGDAASRVHHRPRQVSTVD